MAIPDFIALHGGWAKGTRIAGLIKDGKSVHKLTLSGRTWYHMKARCEEGSEFQKRCPTYVGCYMSDKFKDFQEFVEWNQSQVGYGIEKYDLDKDILVKGNKEYGEDFCVYVPHVLNNFLCAANAIRGKLPQGVTMDKRDGAFSVGVYSNNKYLTVGRFKTVTEAMEAYAEAKTKEARKWYDRLVAGEFIVDPRVIERMRTWEFSYDT